MKKWYLFLLIAFFIVPSIFANDDKEYNHLSADRPMSFNGTYEIDRFILRTANNILIDSENDYDIDKERGLATIQVNVKENCVEVELVYKMQMAGPIFQNKEFSKYKFIYNDTSYNIKKDDDTSFAQAMSALGFTIFDKETLIVKIPFENNIMLMMKLEKESNLAVPLARSLFPNF